VIRSEKKGKEGEGGNRGGALRAQYSAVLAHIVQYVYGVGVRRGKKKKRRKKNRSRRYTQTQEKGE